MHGGRRGGLHFRGGRAGWGRAILLGSLGQCCRGHADSNGDDDPSRRQLELFPHHHSERPFSKFGDRRWHHASRSRNGGMDDRVHQRGGNGRAGTLAERRGDSRRQGCETAAGQPVPQSEPPSGQTALDGRHRPVKLTGRLLVSHPLEVAELDRTAVLEGETLELGARISRRSCCSAAPAGSSAVVAGASGWLAAHRLAWKRARRAMRCATP